MRKVMILVVAIAFTISANAQQGTVQSGIKMYNYKKLVSAQRILTPLAATDPLANYYLGLSYLDQGNINIANALFLKYPDDLANISGLARVAFANKDAAKGMQIAKDLAGRAKKKEWQPLKYAADAITYTKGGDYQQAILWYTLAIAKAGDDADLHIGLGDANRKIAGGGGDAMTNYEDVTGKDPNNSLAFSRIGDEWFDARNYQLALDNFSKAKNADSTNPLPYKSLADAYARYGKYQLALQNITRYLQLSDATISDKLAYVEDLYLAQSYCDAIKSAQEVLSNPQGLTDTVQTELLGIVGFSQINCGDSTEALKNLRTYFQRQKASRIQPQAYLEYGKLYLKLGMTDSASYYYNKGLASDTSQNKTDTYREIAEAFKAKKEYCLSADWYNNLVKANPSTQPLDYFWRGVMYYYCKDLDKTLNAFNEYEAKYPEQTSARYWLGRAKAAIDSDAKAGTAADDFKKWLDMVGPTYDKKNDMKLAYKYLLAYYYNKDDKEDEKIWKEKLKGLDPNDSLIKQIEDAEKAPPAKAKK